MSKDPSLDRFDTMVGELNRNGFLDIGESYVGSLDIRLPDGIDGDFYVLVLTDSPAYPSKNPPSNIGFGRASVAFEEPYQLPSDDRVFEAQRLLGRGRVLEYQLEGNNTITEPIHVTLATPPDLQVTNVIAPERVRAGQSFDITFTVQNFGGDTVPTQNKWDDLVYLSRDRFLDLRADRYLGGVGHSGGLLAGASYDVSGSYRAPSGFDDETEEYYVFVVTDPVLSGRIGQVFELDAENNNDRHSVTPVIFELPPPTDLQVTGVSVPAVAKSGESITVNWTVGNESVASPRSACGPTRSICRPTRLGTSMMCRWGG